MFRRIIELLRILLWYLNIINLYHKYPPKLSNLLLVIGPGRSGTSWLAEMISNSQNNILYLNEPLSFLKLSLPFYYKYDQTVTRYKKLFHPTNPLYISYKLLSNPYFSIDGNVNRERVKYIGKSTEFILIKEVHSLLATEALINHLKCPIILITRNPIYVVDSLLFLQGLKSTLWQAEKKLLTSSKFLNRIKYNNQSLLKKFLNHYSTNNRFDIIITKIIIVSVLNKFLITLSSEYDTVKHIDYDSLCKNTNEILNNCLHFFNLKNQNIKSTINIFSTALATSDPYSVFKNPKEQLNKKMKFISKNEIIMIYKINDRLKLF